LTDVRVNSVPPADKDREAGHLTCPASSSMLPWHRVNRLEGGPDMIDTAGLVRRAPYALSVLRLVSGLIFLEHGLQKFIGFPPGERAWSGWPLNNPPAFAGIVETIAGLLITIGLFTRPAAFIASGTMAVAYWTVHAPQNPFPVNNGGDAAILYCFVFLYLVFAGPGPWSVDEALLRKRGAMTR
jgi:putative oxidoreductase